MYTWRVIQESLVSAADEEWAQITVRLENDVSGYRTIDVEANFYGRSSYKVDELVFKNKKGEKLSAIPMDAASLIPTVEKMAKQKRSEMLRSDAASKL